MPHVPLGRGLQTSVRVATRSTPRAALLFRVGGASSLFAASAWALSTGKSAPSATVAHCQEVESKALSSDVKTPAQSQGPGILGTILGVAGALTAWSVLAGVVVASIVTPFVLVAAVALAQWRLAGALGILFVAPYMVTFPSVPILRRGLNYGLKRWLGPSPAAMCRVVDFSKVSEGEPEPEPQTASERNGRREMICFHPHGPFLGPMGIMALADEKPEVRLLSSPFLYYCAPVLRIFLQLINYRVGSVARSDMNAMMKAGDSPLMLVPGGFYEATISCAGHERVFLKKRMGFVKYALRHGYDLVPVYSVGESDLMANPQGGWKWRFLLNGLEIPATLPWGFPLLPLLPRRGVPLVIAVGPPVKMPKIANPTNAELKEHHGRYVAALKELYERAARGTASEGRPLEVW